MKYGNVLVLTEEVGNDFHASVRRTVVNDDEFIVSIVQTLLEYAFKTSTDVLFYIIYRNDDGQFHDNIWLSAICLISMHEHC